MEYLYAALMAGLCVYTVLRMARSDWGRFMPLGVLGLFSVGYYVLPIVFQHAAQVDVLDPQDVADVLRMDVIFFLFLIAGYEFVIWIASPREDFVVTFPRFDMVFMQRWRLIFVVSFAVWVLYFLHGGLTSYSSSNFDAYFLQRSKLAGLLGALSNYAMGAMATCIAWAGRNGERRAMRWMLAAYAVPVILLLTTAQRLSVITPVFVLVAALAVFGQQRTSLKFLAIGIGVLLVISPFMVFLREFQVGHASGLGREKILVASEYFNYGGGDLFGRMIDSIMHRADLINVSVYLKDYIDAVGYATGKYYLSIVESFVPHFFLAHKLYPLSDSGTYWGDLSVIAWTILEGHTVGSLTAFGAIYAYHEGGWFWVPFNGVLTGVSIAFVYVVLGRGSITARWLYLFTFVAACVQFVPPSLFQYWVAVSSLVPSLIVLALVHRFVMPVLDARRRRAVAGR